MRLGTGATRARSSFPGSRPPVSASPHPLPQPHSPPPPTPTSLACNFQPPPCSVRSSHHDAHLLFSEREAMFPRFAHSDRPAGGDVTALRLLALMERAEKTSTAGHGLAGDRCANKASREDPLHYCAPLVPRSLRRSSPVQREKTTSPPSPIKPSTPNRTCGVGEGAAGRSARSWADSPLLLAPQARAQRSPSPQSHAPRQWRHEERAERGGSQRGQVTGELTRKHLMSSLQDRPSSMVSSPTDDAHARRRLSPLPPSLSSETTSNSISLSPSPALPHATDDAAHIQRTTDLRLALRIPPPPLP